MNSKPVGTIYIVRIIDSTSNPMIGIICANGKPGTMCHEYNKRLFNPHDQVLIDQDGYKIISLDFKAY